MHLRLIDYVLWFASPLMQLGVLVAMYRRGLHRDYPYFFNYTLLQVLSEPILFVISRHSYTMYYWGDYFSIALSAILSFAVLQEIFHDAFRPYEALRDLSVILFRWSALVVLLVGVMWAITAAHSNKQIDAITNGILLVQRSVRLMQCGLVFFLLLFSEYLGISRRHVLFGIALGFGIFASVNMLVAAAVSHGSFLHVSVLRQINSGAYNFSVLIWLAYTAFAPTRNRVATAARSKDWNYALEDARVQPAEDSLLDTMDRTVERLLYPPADSRVTVAGAGLSSGAR